MHACLAVCLLIAMAAPAAAHETRPLYVEIAAPEGNEVEMRVVVPASVEAANIPNVSLGAPCEFTGKARRNSAVESFYRCADVTGALLSIDWPAFNPSISTIIRLTDSRGATTTALLDPAQTHWTIPSRPDFSGVARSYFVIGVEHILGGIDHLLFLAGLLFIAGAFRRALVTVTGFTLAHSFTLALVALDIIRISIPAVEAVIALSIVFLAAEIARGNRTTIAWRRPALVATAFGLAHGAGFAAALSEVGLPATEKTTALFFFNVGVEAGQIAIILAVFGALWIARSFGRIDRRPWNPPRPMELAAGYGLGVVSAYWFIERLAAIIPISGV